RPYLTLFSAIVWLKFAQAIRLLKWVLQTSPPINNREGLDDKEIQRCQNEADGPQVHDTVDGRALVMANCQTKISRNHDRRRGVCMPIKTLRNFCETLKTV